MSESESQPLIINEWTIFAHDVFLSQVEELLTQVTNLRLKYPQDYRKKNATKRLAAIAKLAFEVSLKIRLCLCIGRVQRWETIANIGF